MTIKFTNRGAATIRKLALLTGLLLMGSVTAQAQQVNWEISGKITTSSYTAYRISDDASIHPGIGMRYNPAQDWFLFGEAHHANHVPKSQEPPLFNSEEPRAILIGGGIYF